MPRQNPAAAGGRMPGWAPFWRVPLSKPHTLPKSGAASWASARTASFAISIAFNFLGIALIVYVLVKSKVPQAFRERTAAIQKGIKEAQAASADAARRLSDIEARLARSIPR